MKIIDAICRDTVDSLHRELIESSKQFGFDQIDFPENLRIRDSADYPDLEGDEYIEDRVGCKYFIVYNVN